MPIVVRAVPKEEFRQWLASRRPAPAAADPATAVDAAGGTGSGIAPSRAAAPDEATDPGLTAPDPATDPGATAPETGL